VDRVSDLRADYERLGVLLRVEGGSGAASIARERRLIGEVLDRLESGERVSFVDELAAKRSDAGSARRSGRRKSG
jgi:hypothetical protein